LMPMSADCWGEWRRSPSTAGIADRAGLLRRQRLGVRLPDALIAATALVQGLALATKNPRDFTQVPGLRQHRS